MTRSQAENKRRAAIAMLQRFGRQEEAEHYQDMTPEEYASARGAEIISNPNRRGRIMAKREAAPTRAELEDRIDELEGELENVEEERDALAEQVEQIEEILGVEEEEDDENLD